MEIPIPNNILNSGEIMQIKSEELKEFVEGLNTSFNEKIIAEKMRMTAEISLIKTEIKNNSEVILRNGETKKYKMTEIIPVMYEDIKLIKGATGVLIDANKIHAILKRRKKIVYPVIGFFFTPPALIWTWQNFIQPTLKVFGVIK